MYTSWFGYCLSSLQLTKKASILSLLFVNSTYDDYLSSRQLNYFILFYSFSCEWIRDIEKYLLILFISIEVSCDIGWCLRNKSMLNENENDDRAFRVRNKRTKEKKNKLEEYWTEEYFHECIKKNKITTTIKKENNKKREKTMFACFNCTRKKKKNAMILVDWQTDKKTNKTKKKTITQRRRKPKREFSVTYDWTNTMVDQSFVHYHQW